MYILPEQRPVQDQQERERRLNSPASVNLPGLLSHCVTTPVWHKSVSVFVLSHCFPHAHIKKSTIFKTAAADIPCPESGSQCCTVASPPLQEERYKRQGPLKTKGAPKNALEILMSNPWLVTGKLFLRSILKFLSSPLFVLHFLTY